MPSDLERILSDDYLGDLQNRSIDDVRTMRTECTSIETGLSYLRRLVQGRLDIVGTELGRRRDGGDPGDLSALIGKLPEILSDRTRAPGLGRLPTVLGPGEVDPKLEAEFDAIVEGHDVESLPTVSDDELSDLQTKLEEMERQVSVRRRELFERIDALQAEITRRYRTGEASVESLLQ